MPLRSLPLPAVSGSIDTIMAFLSNATQCSYVSEALLPPLLHYVCISNNLLLYCSYLSRSQRQRLSGNEVLKIHNDIEEFTYTLNAPSHYVLAVLWRSTSSSNILSVWGQTEGWHVNVEIDEIKGAC